MIAVGCSVAVRAWRSGSVERATSLLALSTAAVVTAVLTILLPAAATSFTARDLALALNSHPILPARLLVVRERIGSLVFYLDPRLRHGLTPDRFQTVQAREIRERVVPRDTLVAVRRATFRGWQTSSTCPESGSHRLAHTACTSHAISECAKIHPNDDHAAADTG